jgi:hypothetical protein
MEMMINSNPNANGEDLMTLEAEITELQRENARVESQMLRLKTDINAMENQLGHGERVRKIRLVEAGDLYYYFICFSIIIEFIRIFESIFKLRFIEITCVS